ncbi:MAG: TatD family hydrolase [Bacilli bacterium]|nr:TatD family hydrolase [Bacilli bacterium]
MLVDTHCHVYSEYYDNIEEVIKRSRDAGVGMMVVNGVDRKSNEEILRLVKEYDIVYGALGIQPESVETATEEDFDFIEKHIGDDKIVAIGEIGLDYHYDIDREKQKEVFKRQLEIAKKYNKPVIVHSRDCIQETYDILKLSNVKGIMHCYSGSVEMAREFVKIGFYLGIGGIVTFKNAVKLLDVIKDTSLEYIVLETDSPYLSPEPYRGKVNEPANVHVILQKICAIKGLDYMEASRVTTENVLRLFDK